MILTEKQQMVLTQNQHQEHQKVHEEDDSDRQRSEIIKTRLWFSSIFSKITHSTKTQNTSF